MKILAAIVTHNRAALLARCIDAIGDQSRPPDRLIVIDNDSSDGTVDMLRDRGVDYVTQPNLGSAGGWRRAIKQAMDGDWDAVWLMDDDGYPASGALARLEAGLRPDVSCISSVVLREDDPASFVFPFPVLDRDGLPVLLGMRRKIHTLEELKSMTGNSGTYPFAHLFNGALVRTDVARRIGNVNSDFFLMGDEVDYFMRMRCEGAVLSDVGAHHLHPDVSKRPLNPTKFYYYIKNTIILNRRYFSNRSIRHLATVTTALARTARRNSWMEALSYVAGRRAPILWKAVRRGLAEQVGQDFDA